MKKQIHWLAVWLFVLVLGLTAGCSVFSKADNLVVKRTPVTLREARTNTIERVVTNYVTATHYITNLVTIVPASTNAAGEVLVPAIVQPQVVPLVTRQAVVTTNLEVLYMPPVVTTNYSLAPGLVGAVQTAGELAPVPWGGALGSGVIAVAGIVFGWFNRRRALKALGEKETWQTAAKTVVENFEELRKTALRIPQYAKIDGQIMNIVKGAQLAAGVKPEITGLVDAITDHTVRTEIPIPSEPTRGTSARYSAEALYQLAKSNQSLTASDYSPDDWAFILRARG
jgi:hypothetical protein